MKETGIIMSGNHPKLVLDGVKTQTRRTTGLQIINQAPDDWILSGKDLFHHLLGDTTAFIFHHKETGEEQIIKCPYGQVGDRLWVREKALYWTGGAGGTSQVVYSDDPKIPHLLEDNNTLLMIRETTNILAGQSVVGKWKWKPSIHMPHWASRITLEITEVRVERVKEIKPADVTCEGLGWDGKTLSITSDSELEDNLIGQFASLWDSLNAKRGYGWEANPWVWVLNFKVLKWPSHNLKTVIPG